MLANINADVRGCMYDGIRTELRLCVRDSRKIISFLDETCGSSAKVLLMGVLGWSNEKASEFVLITAQDELKRVPNLRLTNEQNAKKESTISGDAALDITKLTEAEFNKQFRCPETYSNEDESKDAFANSFIWYQAQNKKLKGGALMDGFMSFRIHKLKNHHCSEALNNISANREVKTSLSKIPQLNWQHLATTSLGSSMYFEASKTRKTGTRVKLWTLIDHKQPDENASLSQMLQQEFDCKNKKLRPLQLLALSGNMGEGSVLFELKDFGDMGKWAPISGDVYQALWGISCENQ